MDKPKYYMDKPKFKLDDEVIVINTDYYDDLKQGAIVKIFRFVETTKSKAAHFFAIEVKSKQTYFLSSESVRHLNDIEKVLYGSAEV